MIKRIVLQAYFMLRLPVIWIARLVGGPFIRPSKGLSSILLIRLDRMGDLVLTLPVIDNLKAHHPGVRIAILVRPYTAELARMISSIDDVIVYNSFFSTITDLRRRDFSIAIDMRCDYTLLSALLAFFSGAPRRLGFEGGSREILFTDAVKPKRKSRHMSDINLDLVRALGLPVRNTIPSMKVGGLDRRPGVIVAIHPGGYYPSQRWSLERFAAVADRIARAYNVAVVVVGGPNDRELIDGVMAYLPGEGVEGRCTGLKELVDTLSRSSLLICNNSGPLHLAAALGIPTVSTMGPTDKDLWWPLGANQIVIRKELPCSSCGMGLCRSHDCMDAITVEEVFQKAKSILDRIDGIKKN